MNHLKRLCAGALTVLAFWLATPVSQAQNFFGLGVSATPNPVLVSNYISYTILVTNTSGFDRNDVFVTNAVSSAVVFDNASSNFPGTNFVTSEGVVFQITFMQFGSVAQLKIDLAPEELGFFTNRISATAFGLTNVTSTNVVTEVKYPDGDLAVGMTSASDVVLTNDPTVIGLLVTNLGSTSVSGVVVSNLFPAAFQVVGVSPANASYSTTNGIFIWNAGSMSSGATTKLLVTVLPTVVGSNILTAVVSGNVIDINAANNAVTNILNVAGYYDADLVITPSAPQLNQQTGLMERWVSVLNNSSTNVPAIRLFVSGLTNANTYLYNAIGTNSDGAYVQYNSTLAGGASVNLLLEFYTLIRFPFTNYNLKAVALPAHDLTTAATNGVIISGMMTPAGFLVEFPATIGQTYTIEYASDATFTNALLAQPAIVAPATRVQWIDSGPPKTVSPPTSGSRVYRVREGQ